MSCAKPTNVPWISPYIITSDADKSIDFYQKAYGFELHEKIPGDDGKTKHSELSYKGQLIMLGSGSTAQSPAVSGVESPIALYFYTENVDEFYKKAIAAGAESIGLLKICFGEIVCAAYVILMDLYGALQH